MSKSVSLCLIFEFTTFSVLPIRSMVCQTGTLVIKRTQISFILKIYVSINIQKVSHVRQQGTQVLGFIKSIALEYNFSLFLKTLFSLLVRSILEYSLVVYNFYTVSDSPQLKRVQQIFLAFKAYIFKINQPPHDYSQILRYLGVCTFIDQRLEANLSFFYKLLHGAVDCLTLLANIHFCIPM